MRSPARRQSVNVILTQSIPVHPSKSEQKLGEHAATGGLRGHRALATVGPHISSSDNGAPSASSKGQGPELALQRRLGRGKASRLCPRSSDVDLFGYGKSVIDLNAEVAHRTLNLLVPQQSCAIIRILLSH